MQRVAVVILLLARLLPAQEAREGDPMVIGSRLELLLDDALVERLSGEVQLRLHHPVPREVVFSTDAPWEGNASGYQSVFFHDGRYRMYYRGGHYPHGGLGAASREAHPWVLCYAESEDGIHWLRPELGLCEWQGDRANNIVVDTPMVASFSGCPAHTAVFVDQNPACPAAEVFKVIVVGSKPRGLYVLGSPDGLRFRVLTPTPIQTVGAFDSQNLVFWDTLRGEYRMYHRGFRNGVRDILTATSPDISHFPEPEWLSYPGSPTMALYTNQIQPYFRAPHLFVGFPMRYCDRGWSGPMLDLPGRDERVARAGFSRRYGTTVTDAVFMSSRDGRTFSRWSEAFLRPGPKQSGSWVYGDNFLFWGLVQTESVYGDAPTELSLYATEGYWEGTATDFRRYTLRTDGFVSLHGSHVGGDVVTHPLIFSGGSLALNVSTSAFGAVQVELQDESGTPLSGYSLEACDPIFGDRLDHIVRWQGHGGDLRQLAGRSIRLRLRLSDADLYAFQFVPYEGEPQLPDLSKTGYIPAKNPERHPFTVLEDDFSGVPAGTSPTSANLNPAVGDGDSGWVIREGEPDRVQVLNDDPVGSGRPGTGAYLKVERRDEQAKQGGCAWIKLAAQDAADSQNGIVEVWARILVPEETGYCADIDAFDTPPGEYHQRAFQVRFFPDGTVRYWREEAGHVVVEGVRFVPGAWTDVHIRADLGAGEFALSVDGQHADDLPFGSPGVHRVQYISLSPNAANCVIYVDSVRVQVIP